VEKKCQRSLVRVKFRNPISYLKGRFGPDAVTPGGAIFPVTHLETVDVARRTLVFKPGCRVRQIKRLGGAWEFYFRSGHRSMVSASHVKKVDRVKLTTCSRVPAPLKDRVCLQVTVPDGMPNNVLFRELIKEEQKRGNVIGLKAPYEGKIGEVPVKYFEILVKKECSKTISAFLLRSGIVFSGREWMIFTRRVFPSELVNFTSV